MAGNRDGRQAEPHEGSIRRTCSRDAPRAEQVGRWRIAKSLARASVPMGMRSRWSAAIDLACERPLRLLGHLFDHADVHFDRAARAHFIRRREGYVQLDIQDPEGIAAA